MSILGSLTEIASKTVETGRAIVNSLGVKAIPKSDLANTQLQNFDSARSLLGSIYALIASSRALEIKSRVEVDNSEKKHSKDQDKQISEIVKALSIRRLPKPKPKISQKTKTRPTETTTPEPPSSPGPSANPSTSPQATTPKGPSTATKVATGVAAATGVGAAIGASESQGSYEVTFGDRVKSGEVVRGPNMSPEQRFGKKLTDLTLEEVNILGKERNKQKQNTSAMGKYQFMNSTLFGYTDKNGVFHPGLVQQKGYDPKTTKFTKDVQEEMYELLHKQDVSTLKKLGVPVTPGYEYMAHYVGAGGAAAVYNARNSDMTVAQAIVAAGYKDPSPSNRELTQIKAKDFEGVLEGRLKKRGLSPHSAGSESVPEVSAERIESSSKENDNLKSSMEDKKQSSVNNIINNKTGDTVVKSSSSEEYDDRNAHQKK